MSSLLRLNILEETVQIIEAAPDCSNIWPKF
jgi:hypothetical protein